MPFSRVATSCLRTHRPPNPLLLALPSRARPFSDLPAQHADAALAEARKPDAAADGPPSQRRLRQQQQQQFRPHSHNLNFSPRDRQPQQQQQERAAGGKEGGEAAGEGKKSSYMLVREAQRRWEQGRRTHTTGEAPPAAPRGPNAAAAGVLDGMLASIIPPASSYKSPAAFTHREPGPAPGAPLRPKLDFAGRWASEVKAMDRDLSLAPRDAYAIRVRSTLGSGAITTALRNMKRLVIVSGLRGKMHSEKSHERPGLKRKRLKMLRWRRRFAGDFRKICQRANKLAGQGW
jgi:hypothetical protein